MIIIAVITVIWCPSLLWLSRTTHTPQLVISSRMQETFEEECIYGNMHTDDVWHKQTNVHFVQQFHYVGLTHTRPNFKLEYWSCVSVPPLTWFTVEVFLLLASWPWSVPPGGVILHNTQTLMQAQHHHKPCLCNCWSYGVKLLGKHVLTLYSLQHHVSHMTQPTSTFLAEGSGASSGNSGRGLYPLASALMAWEREPSCHWVRPE